MCGHQPTLSPTCADALILAHEPLQSIHPLAVWTPQHQVGTFEEGKEFDALLVDVNVPGGPFDIFDGDTMEDQFEKFINLGDDRNIVEVYVQGKLVKRGDLFTGVREKEGRKLQVGREEGAAPCLRRVRCGPNFEIRVAHVQAKQV